jgi:hypothetical protein
MTQRHCTAKLLAVPDEQAKSYAAGRILEGLRGATFSG